MMRALPSPNSVRPGLAGATTSAVVRGLVEWAVTQRRTLNKYGWSRTDAVTMAEAMRPLECWLRTNLHPSPETLKRLWRDHEAALRYVMPGNKAGKARLQHLETLMNTL